MEIDFSPNVELEFGLSTTSAPDIEFGTGGVTGAIDVVKVNGTPLPIVNRAVDVPVPTKTSQLTNDSHFITSSDIPPFPTVPTKTSQLENDSGYITKDVDNLTYYTKTSDLPAPITVDSALSSSSTNPVQNQALYPAIVPTEIRQIAYIYDWSDPSGTGTYNSVAILTLPSGSFTDNSLIELVFHDQFDLFAKHGFMLYGAETSSQRVWLNSIGKPTVPVSFTFRIWKWGN